MPSIGTMSIQITADMSRLLTGLQRLLTGINGVTQQSNRASSALKTMGAAAAAFKAIDFAQNTVHDAFGFVQQAEMLQLGTQQLGALKIAAAEAGADFANLSRWLNHINVDLGQATLSGDRAQKKFTGLLNLPSKEAQVFTRLGLDVKKLADLPADKRFREIARAVTDLTSSEDQLAAAESLLGRNVYGNNAKQFLQVLRSVRYEYDELQRKSKTFGFSLSDEQINNIKRGKAALADLHSVWEGFKVQLAARLAPVFDKTLDRFITAIDEMGGIPTILERALSIFNDMKMSAEDFGDILLSSVGKFIGLWAQFQMGFGKLMELTLPESRQASVKELQDAAVNIYLASEKAEQRVFNRMTQRRHEAAEQWKRDHPFRAIGSVFREPITVQVDMHRAPLPMSEEFKARLRRDIHPNDRVTADVSGILGRDFKQTAEWRRTAQLQLANFLKDNNLGQQSGLVPAIIDRVNWSQVVRYVQTFNSELTKAIAQLEKPKFRDQDNIRLWTEQAQLLAHQLATPAEQLAFMAEQLDKMRDVGGLSPFLHDLALFQEFGKAEKAAGLQQVNLAPAASFGSAQAASIISNFEVRRPTDQQARIAAFAEQQTHHQEMIRRLVENFMRGWTQMQRDSKGQ